MVILFNSYSTVAGEMPMLYKIGEQVRWRNAVPESKVKNALGTITAVIPNETGVDDFTLYEINFDFGAFTLYGGQIEPDQQSKAS
jgi:hypothetical protein